MGLNLGSKLNGMAKSSSRSHGDWDHLQKLFSRYLENDVAATGEVFSELLRVIQGYFYLRMDSRPDAEDLTQATLLKIHFARDRFDSKQSLKTWIFTIASRSLIDHWRGAGREPKSDLAFNGDDADEESLSVLDEIPSLILDPETKTELHHDLNKALSKLKPIDRSIVYLYGVEGLSMAEIAQVHGITEGATKLRAFRAYQEIRGTLGVLAVLFMGLGAWLEKLWK
jgi:RNA polymerase sigma-70 factor (ECF subfamily)